MAAGLFVAASPFGGSAHRAAARGPGRGSDAYTGTRVGGGAKRPLEGTTDKFVCEVEVAPGDVRRIVAASAHPLEVGWGVPVALAGADLPTGDSIHEENFHGRS